MRLRGSGHFYQQVVECQGDAAGGWCGVECDGGRFSYRFKSNGALLVDFRKTGGMQMQAACDGEGNGRWLGGKASDDQFFLLDPASVGVCP